MKNMIVLGAGLLVLLNALAPFSPDPRTQLATQAMSFLLGGAIFFLGLKIPRPGSIPATPRQELAPRTEAEIVALLALLQEHGRLVDFAKEDISSASDQQVGSAARVVHAGCRKVLDEYFEIAPLRSETEGAEITLEHGRDTEGIRLLGSVPEKLPYRGRLLHAGWISRSVKLPRISVKTGAAWPVVAPAEIEVSS